MVPILKNLLIVWKCYSSLFYKFSREVDVIVAVQVFLDPEVVITGWEEHNFGIVIVVPLPEHIHGIVEKHSLISPN